MEDIMAEQWKIPTGNQAAILTTANGPQRNDRSGRWSGQQKPTKELAKKVKTDNSLQRSSISRRVSKGKTSNFKPQLNTSVPASKQKVRVLHQARKKFLRPNRGRSPTPKHFNLNAIAKVCTAESELCCYRCGESGHLSKDCKIDRGVECSHCNKIGHEKGACFKLPENKRKFKRKSGGGDRHKQISVMVREATNHSFKMDGPVQFKTAKANIVKASRTNVKKLLANSRGNSHVTNVANGHHSLDHSRENDQQTIVGFGIEKRAIGHEDIKILLTDAQGRERILHLKDILFMPEADHLTRSVSKTIKDESGYTVLGDDGGFVKHGEPVFTIDDVDGLHKDITVFNQRAREQVWHPINNAFSGKMREHEQNGGKPKACEGNTHLRPNSSRKERPNGNPVRGMNEVRKHFMNKEENLFKSNKMLRVRCLMTSPINIREQMRQRMEATMKLNGKSTRMGVLSKRLDTPKYDDWSNPKCIIQLTTYKAGSQFFINNQSRRMPRTEGKVETWFCTAKPRAVKMGSQMTELSSLHQRTIKDKNAITAELSAFKGPIQPE
jgi:hypothetical protein